jgi:2'-5' RNA ligase
MGFAVEMYFDSDTELAVRRLRRELTNHGLKSVLDEMGDRPHISLAVIDDVDPALLNPKLKVFALVTEKMPLILSAIGSFPSQEGILYLAPAVSRSLLEVHYNFHELLAETEIETAEYYRPGNWVPHCTIAQGLESNELTTAFAICSASLRPIHGMICEIGLSQFRPVTHISQYHFS